MHYVWFDFETYYDQQTYTLRDMTPAEYINNERFEALGCAFIFDDGPAFWIDGPDLDLFFKTIDWTKCVAISHNALFDACILAWRYDVHPAVLGDTLSMSRQWLQHAIPSGSCSLDSVSQHIGLGAKQKTILKMSGVNYVALRSNPQLYEEFKSYGIDDVAKCKQIWKHIIDAGYPLEQLQVIDATLRMATKPGFIVDPFVLSEHLKVVQQDKAELLAQADMPNNKAVMSDNMLALMLNALGVKVPRKISKTTGKEAFAFAKSDKAFTDLLEHDNPQVQAIVAARLGHKSTLEETRTRRFITIANLVWPKHMWPYSMPIALKVGGAHTGRLSGDWKLNQQNLRNAKPGRPPRLRQSLRAPPRKLVVSVDASQIECRINAVIARDSNLVMLFRNGVDVYAEFASLVFGHPVTKKDHPRERTIGKVGELSLGYGSQWQTFQNMLRVSTSGEITVSDSEAAAVVNAYRSVHRPIVDNWGYWNQQLADIADGRAAGWTYGPITLGDQCIILPNGMPIRYYKLRVESSPETGKLNWVYNRGRQVKKLYGAKIVENYCQALAGIHIMECGLTIRRDTGLGFAHQVHDELIWVVEAHMAEEFARHAASVFATPPKWLPRAPFAAEFHIGESYGDLK